MGRSRAGRLVTTRGKTAAPGMTGAGGAFCQRDRQDSGPDFRARFPWRTGKTRYAPDARRDPVHPGGRQPRAPGEKRRAGGAGRPEHRRTREHGWQETATRSAPGVISSTIRCTTAPLSLISVRNVRRLPAPAGARRSCRPHVRPAQGAIRMTVVAEAGTTTGDGAAIDNGTAHGRTVPRRTRR